MVKELLARGADVKVLIRSAEKVSGLPKGVTAVAGNLLERPSVRRVFDGCRFSVPVERTQHEAYEGLMAVCGMLLAGGKRLVDLSVQRTCVNLLTGGL